MQSGLVRPLADDNEDILLIWGSLRESSPWSVHEVVLVHIDKIQFQPVVDKQDSQAVAVAVVEDQEIAIGT